MTRSVVYFGTYDPAYPRSAVLIAGLRQLGVDVYELQAPLPALTAAEMATGRGAARLACGVATAHARLLAQLSRRPRVPIEAVVVGYPGHFAMPLARLARRLFRAPLVFDPLVALADTFIGDRGLVGQGGWKAVSVRAVDEASFRLADLVIADTSEHARYFQTAFRLSARRLAAVPIGALPVPAADGRARDLPAGAPLRVFQYGKWSPLHGADTVVAAADLLRERPFHVILAGEGQLSAGLRSDIFSRRLGNVQWLGSLSPAALTEQTLAADVCLGIFGRSPKADRVVPNKVYDALACGRPLVTADTPGIRELLVDDENALLVPPASPVALASVLERLLDRGERERYGAAALMSYRRSLTPTAVAATFLAALSEARAP